MEEVLLLVFLLIVKLRLMECEIGTSYYEKEMLEKNISLCTMFSGTFKCSCMKVKRIRIPSALFQCGHITCESSGESLRSIILQQVCVSVAAVFLVVFLASLLL